MDTKAIELSQPIVKYPVARWHCTFLILVLRLRVSEVNMKETMVLNPISKGWWILLTLLGVFMGVASHAAEVESSELFLKGRDIYRAQCADCHGERGEGVEEKCDETLVGTRSLESLTRRVVRTMPEEDPELCIGDDALAVSTYVYHAFYSQEAQARLGNGVRVELSRLTVPQYLNSVADMLLLVTPDSQGKRGADHALKAFQGGEPGLSATYFQSKGMNKANEQKLERIDLQVDFDFKEGSPDASIEPDQFAIIWEGGMFAESTGHYEFRVSTQNGARLYVNNDPGRQRGKLRDDSSVAGQQALIDGWVSSGEMRSLEARVFLLGGRHYPIRLEYFKYLEKTGSIKLEWRKPHGVWRVMGSETLNTHRPPRTFVVETSFPADDRSLGYERGSSVSWSWYEAVTQAAVATASEVVGRLPLLAGFEAGDENRAEKLKEFLPSLATLAYRRPLSEEEDQLFRNILFAQAENPEIAVRRGVMLALTSPEFLYTPWDSSGNPPDAHQLASRLSLTLWDSVPDQALLHAAHQGELSSEHQIIEQAKRMLNNPRTRFKMRGFFDHWLEIEERDLRKDEQLFPDFDEALVVDLRRSLDLFIEDVVWSDASDYRQLLLADYMMLNPFLKKFYLPDQQDTEALEEQGLPTDMAAFEKVAFPKEQRSGVLTHPYLLSAFAYHNNTSPIHRGVFLTRNIVGRALKPPPMAIAFKDSDFPEDITMREKITQLTSDKACMACHSIINPLGFALESFDAVGRWRTHEKDKPVDTLSEYLSEDGESIQVQRARDIAQFAVKDELAHTAFVGQMFFHLVKQSPDAFEPGALQRLRLQFEQEGFNIRSLITHMSVLAVTLDHQNESITKQ